MAIVTRDAVEIFLCRNDARYVAEQTSFRMHVQHVEHLYADPLRCPYVSTLANPEFTLLREQGTRQETVMPCMRASGRGTCVWPMQISNNPTRRCNASGHEHPVRKPRYPEYAPHIMIFTVNDENNQFCFCRTMTYIFFEK